MPIEIVVERRVGSGVGAEYTFTGESDTAGDGDVDGNKDVDELDEKAVTIVLGESDTGDVTVDGNKDVDVLDDVVVGAAEETVDPPEGDEGVGLLLLLLSLPQSLLLGVGGGVATGIVVGVVPLIDKTSKVMAIIRSKVNTTGSRILISITG